MGGRRDAPAMRRAPVKFKSGGEFHRELDSAVQLLLEDGTLLRRAYIKLWIKAAVVLAWALASYLVLVFVAGSWPVALAAAVSLGLAAAGIGFTIMHDANHRAFSKTPWVNQVMGLSLDLVGGSSYVWSAKHLAHHSYTNCTEHDPDINSLPLARFDPAQQPRPWHRYQHVYIWLLYTMVTVRWQFMSDFSFLVRGRAGQMRLRPPNGRALWTLAAGKIVFLIWAVVIPLMFHPFLEVAAMFLLVSIVASLALSLVFQLSHCVEETVFIDPADPRDAAVAWHVHQVESTVDFAKGNRLVGFYTGGLNHQIEHHLYSRLPHTIYPRIAPLVEAAAQRHGITYTHQPTIKAALGSHTRWLKQMGTAPRPAPAGS